MANNVGGGFFKNFLAGASQEMDRKLAYKDKYETEAAAQADAKIRENVAKVEPEAALYQRQKDIDAQYQSELLKQKAEAASSIYQHLGLTPSDLPSGLSQASPSVATPAPTIPAPAGPLQTTGQTMPNPFGQPMGGEPVAPTMAPTAPTQEPAAIQPIAPTMTPFEKAQRLRAASAELHARGLHDEAAGVEQLAVAQEKQHEESIRTSKTEPIPNKSAEGTNVNQELLKEVDENKKVSGDSIYLPKELSQNTADDKVYKLDKRTAETIHTPLAQAEMNHQRSLNPSKPEEEVYGLVKNNTLVPTQDIVTLNMNDARITDARKQAAMVDLMSYMKSTYGSDIDGAIKNDKNLQKVFTPKLLKTMTGLSNKKNTAPPLPENE